MKKLVLGLSLCCAFVLLSETVVAVEIQGADQIAPGMGFEELFVAAMPHKVNKAELEAFLAELDAFEAWGNANPDRWNAADETDDTVAEIMSWEELWDNSSLGPTGTIMVVLKLEGAKMMALGETNPEQMKQAMAQIKGMMDNPNVPEELKVTMEAQLHQLQQMTKALDKYPASNTTFYENNKDAIDNALERFESIAKEDDTID